MKSLIMFSLTVIAASHAWAQSPGSEAPSCHIVFDAGSSGTRLYVFEQEGENWVSHEGPRSSALADPIREIRDKTWKDADKVVNDVVESFTSFRQSEDWPDQCAIASASVYATAGMRIAEQENGDNATKLWEKLNEQMSAAIGTEVDTRTITGFEEGLYAWLAIRESRDDAYFGLLEMGGASAQIVFLCDECVGAKPVLVKGDQVQLFSYSFLGLGQDEAMEVFDRSPVCAEGAATFIDGWTVADCEERINLVTTDGIYDPYNINPGQDRGIYVTVPIDDANIWTWVLTGAFQFMTGDDIENYCKAVGRANFQPESSCFRSVYQRRFLETFGVSASYKTEDSSWTLGAAICNETECLEEAKPLMCRWTGKVCL